MSTKLLFQAVSKFLLGVLLVGLLIFLPAGTLSYFNGWLLMGILFIPMFFAGIVMMIKNPDLLRKRLNGKEKRNEQGVVVKLSGVMFCAGFIIAGFGVRFNWYALPSEVVLIGVILFVIAYILYAEVLRENAYLSRTIEVQEGQKVIDTGLYGLVRHPMYTATIILFLSIPIVLGSVYAVLVFLLYPVIIVVRLKNEEELLQKELDGYREYMQRVRYRLIPFIW